MDRPPWQDDLLPIWPWLPHFRAVAETEHLPSAARLCGVGPSSLSRSIGLLERHLGRPLFERTGRSLRRNDDGTLLLDAVRDAMRRVHEGCADLRGGELRGRLRIASSGAGTTALVAPAVRALRERHPEVEPQLVTRPVTATAAELLRGELDVAFQEAAAQHDSLTTERVADLTRGVYCARGHALFVAENPSEGDLCAAEFVAPPQLADGTTPDGWPADRARDVAITTDQLRVGLELCIDQQLLAVLPDALAARHTGELRRLDAIPIAPSPVFAVHRKVLGPRASAAARLVELVRG